MDYRIEFPDFPEGDMPPIPAGFTDHSWHNDACPIFWDEEAGFALHIDYADQALSDFADCPDRKRFGLYRLVNVEGEWDYPDDSCPHPTLAFTDDWNEVLAAIMGERFARLIFDGFSEAEVAEIKRRNGTPEYAGSVCATHDFCDANMVMAEAFESVMGRGLVMDDADPRQQPDFALWGAAWAHAKAVHLSDATPTTH